MTDKELSNRAILAQWVRQRVDGEDEYRLPDLVEEAAAHFAGQPIFVTSYLRESLRPIVYEVVRRVVGETRRLGDDALIELGDEVVRKKALAQRAKWLRQKWTNWMEHVGDRQVNLMQMTRDDLLTAAAERRKRANTELEIAGTWEVLAQQLQPGQRVGQVFPPEEIERIRQQMAHVAAERTVEESPIAEAVPVGAQAT